MTSKIDSSYRAALVGVALLGLAGCEAPPGPPQLDDAAIERLTLRAPLIFEGSVIEPARGAAQGYDVEGPAALVQIGSILRAPAALGDYGRRIVSVSLERPIAPGERALFFASGIAYGRTLAVRELGRIPSPTQSSLDFVEATVQQLPTKLLRLHIDGAELVVVGRVDRILSPSEPNRELTSEHYPDWRGARIRISSVERGAYDKPTLVVPFPFSQDVMYRSRPRFTVDQQGIWILHRHSLDPSGNGLFNVEHDSDFLPRASLPVVRRQITELASHSSGVRP